MDAVVERDRWSVRTQRGPARDPAKWREAFAADRVAPNALEWDRNRISLMT